MADQRQPNGTICFLCVFGTASSSTAHSLACSPQKCSRSSFSGSPASITHTFSITSRASLVGFAIQRTADTAPADRSLPSMILASISTSPFAFRTDPQPKPRRSWKAKVKIYKRLRFSIDPTSFSPPFVLLLEEHRGITFDLVPTGLDIVCLPQISRTIALR